MTSSRLAPSRSPSPARRRRLAPAPNTTRPGSASYVNCRAVGADIWSPARDMSDVGRCTVAPGGTLGQPRVALRVLAGVVGIEVDEAALDLEVADLEYVAPASRGPVRHAGAPRAVAGLAVARALRDDRVGAGEDPVEVGVVVADRLQRRADVAEQLSDLLLAVGEAPLGEVDLRVFGEEVQDAVAGRSDASVVERLEVLERDRSALLVRHRLRAHCHGLVSSVSQAAVTAGDSSLTASAWAAFAAR